MTDVARMLLVHKRCFKPSILTNYGEQMGWNAQDKLNFEEIF